MVLGFQNCGSTEAAKPTASQNQSWPDQAQAYKSIQDMSSEDVSCSADADCTTIEYGQHGCGGPNGYSITSLRNSRLAEIQSLAQEITEQEQNFWRNAQGVADTCVYLGPIGPPKCVANKCVD